MRSDLNKRIACASAVGPCEATLAHSQHNERTTRPLSPASSASLSDFDTKYALRSEQAHRVRLGRRSLRGDIGALPAQRAHHAAALAGVQRKFERLRHKICAQI